LRSFAKVEDLFKHLDEKLDETINNFKRISHEDSKSSTITPRNFTTLAKCSKVCSAWLEFSQHPSLWSNLNLFSKSYKITNEQFIILSARSQGHLRRLIISYCKKIDESTLISVINNNPRLTYLDILGTHVTNTFFTNISNNTNTLQYLNMGFMHHTFCTGVLRNFFQKTENLRYLDLSFCCISADVVTAIATHCTQLIHLNLCRTMVDDKCVTLITKHCKNLTNLTLSDNLSLTDIALINVLENCKKLEYLSLRKCALLGGTVENIFKKLPNLVYLDIKFTGVLCSIYFYELLLEKGITLYHSVNELIAIIPIGT